MLVPNNQQVVVVIDDDLQISQALGTWFHIMGVRGSFHSTAEGFLDTLVRDAQGLHVRMDASSRNSYGLAGVIVDLNLPGINGVKLIQKLHQLQANLPLVLITALREEERARYGDLPPGVVCVKKPFDLDTLEQALFGHSTEQGIG